jgi:hypothetical protein
LFLVIASPFAGEEATASAKVPALLEEQVAVGSEKMN